jgi:hypothetical protein
MGNDGILPHSDAEELKVCHMSILGTTDSMDATQMPSLMDELSRCDAIIGHNKPHTVSNSSKRQWTMPPVLKAKF